MKTDFELYKYTPCKDDVRKQCGGKSELNSMILLARFQQKLNEVEGELKIC